MDLEYSSRVLLTITPEDISKEYILPKGKVNHINSYESGLSIVSATKIEIKKSLSRDALFINIYIGKTLVGQDVISRFYCYQDSILEFHINTQNDKDTHFYKFVYIKGNKVNEKKEV